MQRFPQHKQDDNTPLCTRDLIPPIRCTFNSLSNTQAPRSQRVWGSSLHKTCMRFNDSNCADGAG
jgi:hypothetical protein